MAKVFGIFACLVIVALDAVAGLLGIKAEGAQNQVYISHPMPISLLYQKLQQPQHAQCRNFTSLSLAMIGCMQILPLSCEDKKTVFDRPSTIIIVIYQKLQKEKKGLPSNPPRNFFYSI